MVGFYVDMNVNLSNDKTPEQPLFTYITALIYAEKNVRDELAF